MSRRIIKSIRLAILRGETKYMPYLERSISLDSENIKNNFSNIRASDENKNRFTKMWIKAIISRRLNAHFSKCDYEKELTIRTRLKNKQKNKIYSLKKTKKAAPTFFMTEKTPNLLSKSKQTKIGLLIS